MLQCNETGGWVFRHSERLQCSSPAMGDRHAAKAEMRSRYFPRRCKDPVRTGTFSLHPRLRNDGAILSGAAELRLSAVGGAETQHRRHSSGSRPVWFRSEPQTCTAGSGQAHSFSLPITTFKHFITSQLTALQCRLTSSGANSNKNTWFFCVFGFCFCFFSKRSPVTAFIYLFPRCFEFF